MKRTIKARIERARIRAIEPNNQTKTTRHPHYRYLPPDLAWAKRVLWQRRRAER